MDIMFSGTLARLVRGGPPSPRIVVCWSSILYLVFRGTHYFGLVIVLLLWLVLGGFLSPGVGERSSYILDTLSKLVTGDCQSLGSQNYKF